MTTELTMLTATAAWAIFHLFVMAPVAIKQWGFGVVFGNRDHVPPLPVHAERARRAFYNLMENLPHFAILVLVAHVTGIENDLTALGAQLFFGARVLYPFAYVWGVTGLRSAIFGVGLAGELLILLQLFLQ